MTPGNSQFLSQLKCICKYQSICQFLTEQAASIKHDLEHTRELTTEPLYMGHILFKFLTENMKLNQDCCQYFFKGSNNITISKILY